MSPANSESVLPQLSGQTFLTDGGMETTLVFQKGIELPAFAAKSFPSPPAKIPGRKRSKRQSAILFPSSVNSPNFLLFFGAIKPRAT